MARRVITYSKNVFLPLTTVCRNRCGYCCFRRPVQDGCILDPAAVIKTLRHGARLGCTEALFTFGERPEEEPGFSDHLSRFGYGSILDYCYTMCEEAIYAGLLPHTNAGVLTFGEMERLRDVNASMGIMLETTAGLEAHKHSPGKDPALRLGMIENAGKLRIPFTTGILLGIGETMRDREESLEAIRDIHLRYGHIQEVIVQNFCPAGGTPMAGATLIGYEEYCAVICLARQILPREVAVQIPPNLADASRLIGCGVDDLGGVSPLTIDYVNPDHPWPEIEKLKEIAGEAALVERLCIYPQFIEKGWYPPRLAALILRLHR